MKIATFINDNGQIAGFQEKGTICLFGQENGTWEVQNEINLDLTNETQIGAVKAKIKQAVSLLAGCEVFLVGEMKGAMHVFLEEMGFRVWKSAGTVTQQLDYVAQKDAEMVLTSTMAENQACGNQNFSGCGSGCCSGKHQVSDLGQVVSAVMLSPLDKKQFVVEVSDGFFRIDLAKVLAGNPSLNSKQVLIPFMKETALRKLEILCDHIPRWFNQVVTQLNLQVESEVIDDSGRGVTVIVMPQNQG
jgi:Fe-only nitrogenase accessory protein AnfO